MVEHLVMRTHGRVSREIRPPQSIEVDTWQGTTLPLGVRAVKLSHSMDGIMSPVEKIDNFGSKTKMDDVKDSSKSPEAIRNGELYKQAYDTAIESVESAFEADSTELDGKLVAVLDNMDVLSRTPYISSAPEFVDLVKSAHKNVEEVRFSIASGSSSEMSSAVISALLAQAKQQLVATTVAYRP